MYLCICASACKTCAGTRQLELAFYSFDCNQINYFSKTGECELYLDVDCSGLSYESRPSASVLRAVEDLQRQQQQLSTTSLQQDFGRTESYQESLATSLLSRLDSKSISEAELTEAFCRDVDSFSFEFERQEAPGRAAAPLRPQAPKINSNKPPLCAEVTQSSWKDFLPFLFCRFQDLPVPLPTTVGIVMAVSFTLHR